MAREVTDIGETPRFEQIEPLANEMMERFIKGEIGSVDIAYMKFVSTGKQIPVVERLLPLIEDLLQSALGLTTVFGPPPPQDLPRARYSEATCPTTYVL